MRENRTHVSEGEVTGTTSRQSNPVRPDGGTQIPSHPALNWSRVDEITPSYVPTTRQALASYSDVFFRTLSQSWYTLVKGSSPLDCLFILNTPSSP